MEEAEKYAPTRRSLISRLKNIEDQESWREFFETYWRLIYSVARKSGLDDGEAQDLVQETVLSVTRKIAGFKFDPALGSFKNWLMLITRSRIIDHLRKRARRPELVSMHGDGHDAGIDSAADPAADALERTWEEEWQAHLLDAAVRNVKARVTIQQYQIFELSAFQQQAPAKIAAAMGVGIARVYLTKHRVGRLLKSELISMKTRLEKPRVHQ